MYGQISVLSHTLAVVSIYCSVISFEGPAAGRIKSYDDLCDSPLTHLCDEFSLHLNKPARHYHLKAKHGASNRYLQKMFQACKGCSGSHHAQDGILHTPERCGHQVIENPTWLVGIVGIQLLGLRQTLQDCRAISTRYVTSSCWP